MIPFINIFRLLIALSSLFICYQLKWHPLIRLRLRMRYTHGHGIEERTAGDGRCVIASTSPPSFVTFKPPSGIVRPKTLCLFLSARNHSCILAPQTRSLGVLQYGIVQDLAIHIETYDNPYLTAKAFFRITLYAPPTTCPPFLAG